MEGAGGLSFTAGGHMPIQRILQWNVFVFEIVLEGGRNVIALLKGFSLYLIGSISFTKIHKESAHLPCLSFIFWILTLFLYNYLRSNKVIFNKTRFVLFWFYSNTVHISSIQKQPNQQGKVIWRWKPPRNRITAKWCISLTLCMAFPLVP